MFLSECVLERCPPSTYNDLCSAFMDSASFCATSANASAIILSDVSLVPSAEPECNLVKGELYHGAEQVVLDSQCQLRCGIEALEGFDQTCSKTVDVGNRWLTNGVAFFLLK